MTLSGSNKNDCLVIFSGGTDSTCAAALMADKFSRVHLLTFYQGREKRAGGISDNVASLSRRFVRNKFVHKTISITKLVRFISYDRYGKYFLRHRWLVLSTCGFTSLSWHVNAIVYCLENGIHVVADGLTKELMHFPGHMDEVIGVFRELYREFGIEYINPVRDWATPADKQFIDKLVVNQHGYLFPGEGSKADREQTTGRYLYDLEIMPNPDVKGSAMDHRMQYECYPFVLYNVMVFWIYLNFRPYPYLCERMKNLFEEKADDMRVLLKEYAAEKEGSRLFRLLDKDQE